LFVLGWADFMLIMMFPFGFRGDLDHLDWFKSLPLRPAAIALGEMLPLTCFLTVMNTLALTGLWAALPPHRWTALVAAALNPAVVAMAVAMENLLFLAFPFRQNPGSQGDPQQMGRIMLLMVFRMAALGVVGLAAAGVGALAFFLAGESWLAAGVAVSTLLLAMTAVFVWLTAILFARFDVSVDSPV
jgi:hypothetical protein